MLRLDKSNRKEKKRFVNEFGSRGIPTILSSLPELKRHKGAVTLPAVALCRVLTASGEDAEELLNAYGEETGRRFARIIHALAILPGADPFMWRHVGSVMKKASSEKLGYRGQLIYEPPEVYGICNEKASISN